MNNNSYDWQKVLNPLLDSLKIANQIDVSGVYKAVNKSLVANIPNFSQIIKSATECNEALALSINASNLYNSIDLSSHLTKAINESLSLTMPEISQLIKSTTVFNEVLANCISKYDFAYNIDLTSGLSELINDSLTMNMPDVSKIINSTNDFDESLTDPDVYEEVIKEEYTEEIVDQLINNVDSNKIAQNLEQKTGIKMETWLPIILMIIQTLLMIYSTFNQQPQETNNYHIEIHQQSSNEDINQITYDMDEKMANNGNP